MKLAQHLQIGLMVCVLSLLGGIFGAEISQGATFYVAQDGNDSNPGTETRPFKRIGRGVRALKAGDTLYVRAGTYEESFWDNVPSGTSWNAPVTIAAFPDENVTLRPKQGSERVFLFQGADTHHIIIDGFIMDGVNVSYDVVKISYANDPKTDMAHSIRIVNSEIKNGPSNGILAMGNNNEFINLKVYDNGTDDFNHGIYIASSDNIVDGCEIYNNTGWGVHVYDSNINKGKVNNNIIKNNKIYRNGKSGRGTGIILSSGLGNEAYNNEIWENMGGIQVDYGARESEVYDNTIYRNNGSGIYIGSRSFSTVIEDNDVFDNRRPQIADYGSKTQILP